MPVRRPNMPRRPRPAGPSAEAYARAALAGAESLSDFAEKLEAIANARRRQQGAPPIHVPRRPPTEERARRLPTAEELLGATQETRQPRMPTAQELLDWGDTGVSPPPVRMPTAQELLEGRWDGGGPPDDGGPTEPEGFGTEWYSPTRSIYPPRPRTLEMSYNRQTRLLRVTYRDGGTYDYFDVPGPIWYRIRQVKSPGRFIDRNIKGRFAYEKVAF